ncbi:hypothetical protein Dimus_011997 [Dionaea muscipula]
MFWRRRPGNREAEGLGFADSKVVLSYLWQAKLSTAIEEEAERHFDSAFDRIKEMMETEMAVDQICLRSSISAGASHSILARATGGRGTMNDFHGLLSSDFGLKPQGKSAPMAPPRHNPTSTTNSALNFEIGGRPSSLSKSSSGSFLDDRDTLSRPPSSTTNRKPQDYSNLGGFDDVFVGGGGNSRSGGNSNSPVILDSIFSGSADTGSNFSSMPVFDKPVYDDDDVFDGVSGLKSSSSGRYDGLFNSSSKKNDAFDDFLGGLGRRDPESKGFRGPSTRGVEKGIPGFDDLLNGFGVNSASVPTDKYDP